MQDKIAVDNIAPPQALEMDELALLIRGWGQELGFQQLGFSDTQLQTHEGHLEDWLSKGFHGEMDYMQRHGTLRSRPAELHPGTTRVISARMDYLPDSAGDVEAWRLPAPGR